MESLIPLATFVLGYSLGRWREIRGYLISRRLQRIAKGEEPPPSRIAKVFGEKPKRKPRVNDDQKAWLAENKRR